MSEQLSEILTDSEMHNIIDVCIDKYGLKEDMNVDKFITMSVYTTEMVAEMKYHRLNHAFAEGHI